MSWLDFESHALWMNAVAFAAAAIVIWFAGIRLERGADAIATRTGLGRAFLGALLLASATSLPEVATSITAVQIGSVDLAVHNLLGSIVFNTLVLAIADIVAGRWALTHRSPSYVLLMEGVGVIFLLTLVHMGAAIGGGIENRDGGNGPTLPAGLWEAVILVAYCGVIYVTRRSQKHPRWQPQSSSDQPDHQQQAESLDKSRRQDNQAHGQSSLTRLSLVFAAASLAVLIGGWTVAQAGDALAKQTGLGGSFVGFTLVAIATTLPEISTTISAARGANYEMAVSNIFGSSAFVIMLLGLVGLLAPGQAVIQSAVPSALFAAALGMMVTLIYLWGLLERQDRTVLRMGWDSAAVVLLVIGGSWVMFILQ